jgi:ribose transport system substrate-binding protein
VQDDVIAGLVAEDPFRMGNNGVKTARAASEGEQVSANVDTNLSCDLRIRAPH